MLGPRKSSRSPRVVVTGTGDDQTEFDSSASKFVTKEFEETELLGRGFTEQEGDDRFGI